MITSSPTFCPHPWTSLNIDQTGVVKPCLNSYEYQQDLGNINSSTVQEVIAGARAHELRTTIARGEWDPLCGACQRLEAEGCTSPRQAARADAGVLQAIDQDITYFELQDITINWSNLCNLTCTYCNPKTSTAWQARRNIPITLVRNQHADLIELAKQHTATIRGLTLGGGEPLLQKGLPEFLHHIQPEQTSVMITTNLSMKLESNPVYQTLKDWPAVTWLISFDNANREQFEYVRTPADWDLFVTNIQYLKQTGQHVVAHPAYSIYCALSLVEYYEFCTAHELDIYWCDLRHPYALDIRRASTELRRQAQTEIDRVVELYADHPANLGLATLQNYRLQLEQQDTTTVDLAHNTLDPVAWHRQQEQVLQQRNRFEDLWPQYSH